MARRRLKVDIEGLDEAVAAIRAAGSSAHQAATEALGEELDAVAEDMRSTAPVLTGELVESIEVDHGGLDGTVAATAPHADAQEHGTSRHPAQPFAGPAAATAEGRFPDRVADAVRGAVE
jgi:HK97 gp10 family phage protein